jgi:hypothetical protein
LRAAPTRSRELDMPMLKRGDTALHYGFANGAMANKLFAR